RVPGAGPVSGRGRAAAAARRAPASAAASAPVAGPGRLRPAHYAVHRRPPAPAMSQLAALTIHELAPLLERRAVSPVEVTAEMLARIDALDGRLRAFVTVWPEQALAEARAAEAAIGSGDYRGPLHGVPLSIKDNIAVAGWPTTNGSALMTD